MSPRASLLLFVCCFVFLLLAVAPQRAHCEKADKDAFAFLERATNVPPSTSSASINIWSRSPPPTAARRRGRGNNGTPISPRQSSTTSSTASLTNRCPSSDHALCAGISSSAALCCLKTEKCYTLAGGSTALCCPAGSDCSIIEPIPCDVSLQDPSRRPPSKILTTALDQPLSNCGAGTCCPFGYSCNARNNTGCKRDADQSIYPGTSLAVDSGSPRDPQLAGTGTAAPAGAPTPTPAVNSTAAAPASPQQNVGVAVGSTVVALVFLGGLMTVAWFQRARLSQALARARSRRRAECPNPLSHAQRAQLRGLWETPFTLAHTRWRRRRGRSDTCSSSTEAEDLLTPPPPPFVYQGNHQHHLKLEECRRVPRRRTVGRPAFVKAAVLFSPVELPATPVSESWWASRRKSSILPLSTTNQGRSRASIFSWLPSPVVMSQPQPQQQSQWPSQWQTPSDPPLPPLPMVPPIPSPPPRAHSRLYRDT